MIAIENTRLFEAEQRRSRELAESLEQQTATSEVLQVISRSTFDLKKVLNTLVESAARLCEADMAIVHRLEGSISEPVATYGITPDLHEQLKMKKFEPGRATVAGRVLLERRAVHVHDVRSDPEYPMSAVAEMAGVRTGLGVPLLRESTPIGMFVVMRRKVQPFTERQIELLSTFADQAVIAIENTRLFEAEQQRTRELTESLEQQTATSKVLDVISRSAFDLHAVFEAVVESSVRLCGAERGFIYRFDGELLRMAVGFNVSQELREFAERNPIRPGRKSAAARAALERRTIHIPDAFADPEYTYGAKDVGRFRTVLGVPILKGDDLQGVIIIHPQDGVRPFTDTQIALVETFADQAAIAIENVRLLDELRQRTTDLTESLEQQTATSEVLQVISSSPGDLEPVFATMLKKAVRICDATFGNIYRWDGDALHLVATCDTPPGFAKWRGASPMKPAGPENVPGRLLASHEVVHVTDAAAEPSYVDRSDPGAVAVVELGGVRTALAVPMRKEDELIGSFTMYRQEVRPFTDKQIELVKNFAAQAVIAIENARLLNELRESLEQQTATSKVLDVISRSAFDLRAVFEAVIESSVRLCGADRGHFYRFDGELLRVAAAFNASRELMEFVERTPIPPGRNSASGRAMVECRTVHIPDCLADPEYSWGGKNVDPVRTILAVPTSKAMTCLG